MRLTLIAAAAALTTLLVAGCGGNNTETSPPPAAPAGTPAGGPPGPPPLPGQPGMADAAAGKVVYQANCAGCHLESGKGKLKGQPDFTNAAWQTDHDDAEIMAYVRNGEGAMPAFKDKLTEKQISDVVAYVRTFAAPPAQ